MRPLSEQSHYEVLEIPRDARSDGIERAYRLILATYSEQSLAGYSVVRGADAAAIRERVVKHLASGADHVCVQVLRSDLAAGPLAEWRALAPVLLR